MRAADSWIAAAVLQCLLSCCSIHGYIWLLAAKIFVVGALSPVHHHRLSRASIALFFPVHHHRLGRASIALFFPVTSTSIRATQLDKESSSIDPTRGKGSQGEWAEWENDAHVDDDYSSDEDDDDYSYTGTGLIEMMKYASAAITPYQTTIPSSGLQIQPSAANSSVAVPGDVTSGGDSSSSTITTIAAVPIRGPDYWKGWSEEAPYFDEYDVQDDEGNWGRVADESSTGSSGPAILPVFGGGSSDLWTRYTTPSTDGPQGTSVIASSPTVSADASTHPAIDSSYDAAANDDVTTTILSRLQQLEARLDARLDAISSALPTAAATSPPTVDPLPPPTSALRLQLPPPAVIVPYMVLFATIQALINGFFQRW